MYKNNYNDLDYNNHVLLDNKIKVNKKGYIKNSDILQYSNFQILNPKINFKDGLYYSLEKKYKKSNNKNNLSFNINNISIVSNDNAKDVIKLSKPDAYKKTININSNQNQKKEGNIIEELQNNKYLRPMLGTNNIDIKLLKCQIDEPIKNINNFSLQKYINKHKISMKNTQLSQKDKNRLQNEDKINTYDLNNKSVMEKNNSNLNISSINKISKLGDNNNNSFISKDIKTNNLKYLLKYSPTNLKKYSAVSFGKIPNGKKLFKIEKKENKKDKNSSQLNYYENEINKHYNSMNIKEKSLSNEKENESKNNVKEKNKKNSKDEQMVNIYKRKLVEEFIIVLDKFFSKYLNKKKCLFFKNLVKFKRKSQSKNKIYYRKNNNKFSKKNLTLTSKNNEIKRNHLLFNIEIDKEKEFDKIKTKVITTDTSNNNFNLNNKSFSNEIKSSNLLSNNRFNNHSSSYLFIDQKHKNYSQSPESTLNKNPIKQIKTKTIIYKNLNLNSGSPSRSSSGGRGDTFVYKKKNLNNDNVSINNKNNTNKYSNLINKNKKEQIIGIDINLGKPIRIINDHSPLEEFYLERNEPYLFPLSPISNEFFQTKKNKINSRTKKKNKPPIQLKKFANEDDENEDFFNNFYFDSYKGSSTLKIDDEKNYINMYFENSLREKNNNLINRSIMDTNINKKENIIKENNLYIRTNSFYFYDYKNKNNDNFKSWKIDKNMSLFLLNHKNNEQNKNKDKADNKKKINKLYINCTKFFVKILIRLFKKRIFVEIYKWNKNQR